MEAGRLDVGPSVKDHNESLLFWLSTNAANKFIVLFVNLLNFLPEAH